MHSRISIQVIWIMLSDAAVLSEATVIIAITIIVLYRILVSFLEVSRADHRPCLPSYGKFPTDIGVRMVKTGNSLSCGVLPAAGLFLRGVLGAYAYGVGRFESVEGVVEALRFVGHGEGAGVPFRAGEQPGYIPDLVRGEPVDLVP